jgi:hypothetical protein
LKKKRSSYIKEPQEASQWQLPEPPTAQEEELPVEKEEAIQDDYNRVIALDDKEFGKY